MQRSIFERQFDWHDGTSAVPYGVPAPVFGRGGGDGGEMGTFHRGDLEASLPGRMYFVPPLGDDEGELGPRHVSSTPGTTGAFEGEVARVLSGMRAEQTERRWSGLSGGMPRGSAPVPRGEPVATAAAGWGGPSWAKQRPQSLVEGTMFDRPDEEDGYAVPQHGRSVRGSISSVFRDDDESAL